MTYKIVPEIADHALFSVDIFDTMLHRFAKSPIDMFSFMAEHADVKKVTDYFLDNRVAAENLAREDATKRKAEDVTLDEIYSCFADLTKCTQQEAEAIKTLELKTEMDLLYPTQFALSFLEHVKTHSKRYILTSDMYLPTAELEKILKAKGITGWEKLLVSGDIGRTKHQGTLFKDVIAHFDVPAKKILHIGDNKHADGRRSKEAGLTPLVIRASKDLASRSPKPRKHTHLMQGYRPLTQVFISKFLEDRYSDAESLDFRTLSDDAYFEAFGALVVAPCITSFMIWMKQHLDRQDIKRIAFLARDGMFPKAAFEALYPEGFDVNYIAASRRVLTIPFSEMEPGTIEGMFYTTVQGCETVEAFLKCIAGSDALASYIQKSGLTLDEPLTRETRKSLLTHLADDPAFLMSTFESECDAIEDYYRQAFPAGQTTALFDVGWRGSLQNAISKIIDPSAKMAGFYFGTGWSAINMLQRNGHVYESYACSNGAPAFKSERIEAFRDLIEFLCSADHGSVLRILKSQDGTFEWDKAEIGALERNTLEIAAKIQKGALDAIGALTKVMPVQKLEDYAHPDDVEDFWGFLERPQKQDALRFKDVRIFAGVGDVVGENLSRIGDKRSHYYNVKNSRWRQAYGAHLGKFTKARVNAVLKLRKRPKLR